MEAAFVLVRAAHIGALIAMLGGQVFAIWVAGEGGQTRGGRQRDRYARVTRSSGRWLALAMISGLGWLAFEAISMSGLPAAQALGGETLATVLTETWFGQVWISRGLLSLVLAAMLLATSRPVAANVERDLPLLCTVLVAALLSTLALVGHANSEHGALRLLHLSADALHAFAAGCWLGGLLPLAAMIAGQRLSPDDVRLEDVVAATQRFSRLGLLSVGTLVVSGTVSAWFTVATISGLVRTHYGHLLLIKLVLFSAMLALAGMNRRGFTRKASDGALPLLVRGAALRQLQRNATAEACFGLVIVGIVGALGMTVPAAHAPMMTPSMHMP